MWAPRQNGGHQQIDGDIAQQRRKHQAAEGVDEPNQDGRDEGAAERPDAAYDHDDQGEDEHAFAHAGLDGQYGRGQRAGQARQRGPDAERPGKDAIDVDAQRADENAVAGARPHQHAGAGSGDDQVQRQGDQHADGQDDQPDHGVGKADDDGYRGIERPRQRYIERLRPPYDAGELIEKEDEAQCGQHLVKIGPPVEGLERKPLEHRPDEPRNQGGQHDADPERTDLLQDGGEHIGADHVERAVGQVHQVHDAEHQREPGGDQEQHDAQLQAIEHLLDE